MEPSTVPERSAFYDYLAFDSEPFESVRDTLVHEAPVRLASQFRANMLRTIDALSMPYPFAYKTVLYLQRQLGKEVDSDTSENEEQAHDLLREFLASSRQCNHALLALMELTLIGAWEAFTILTQKIWCSSLNEFPRQIEGVERRRRDRGEYRPLHFGIQDLEEFGNTIRGQSGEILVSFYRFDSLRTIEQAFSDQFGSVKPLPEIWQDKDLQQLELASQQLHQSAEAALSVDGRDVSRFLNSCFRQAGSLLEFLDGWLGEQKRRERNKYESQHLR